MDNNYNKNPIPMKQWVEHFTTLLNKSLKPDINLDQEIDNYIENNRNHWFNELNYRIDTKEILDAAKHLKSNKAAGIDGIINEILKAGMSLLIKPMLKLFNAILTHGHFPSNWSVNTLSPLLKKGEDTDPTNYRGIAVAVSISKLFLTVLQLRLKTFSLRNNIIPSCQIAYKEKHSTFDHILTMKNIIHKYINKATKCRLYVCFVDFKSAFDTVWRKALIYKLIRNGVGGNFINVIESMHDKALYCVKVEGFISDSFSSNVGVKQGCVLSPLLFNIFLSDLPDIFSNECDPARLSDVNISCLMFADDLVLISESAHGLQSCLTKLQKYCDKWCLTINIDKTKVIIFNKGGHQISRHSFTSYESLVEIVKQYCYLGIMFSSNGSFKNACNILHDKALRAFYRLRQIQPHDNVKVALQLFDTLVLPILSYAGVVWGPLYASKVNISNFNSICNDCPIEKLNTRMCRYILGVHRKSTNDAVRGELGRFPVLISILNNSYRYIKLMDKSSNNSLVKISCMDEDLRSLDISWYNSMSRMINIFDQSRSFYHDMKNVYKINWKNSIQLPTSKLRIYSQFKKEFSIENYILQFPLKIRRNLTRLRISAHNLAVETGRYTNTKASKSNESDKRSCFHCKITESEFHLVFECPLYHEARKKLVEHLHDCTCISFQATNELFCNIMSCLDGDTEVGRILCTYVNSCFETRSAYFNYIKEKNILCRPEATETRFGRISRRQTRLNL